MRPFFHDQNHRRPHRTSWAPLLVLGLSVMASVVLISVCMTMLWPEIEAGPVHLSRAAEGPPVR